MNKCPVSSAFLALLCFCLSLGVSAADAEPSGASVEGLRPSGYIAADPETQARLDDRFFTVSAPVERIALPSRVVNTLYLPAVSSQGSLGICGSFAVFYYLKTYQEAKLHGWEHPDPAVDPEHVFSPAWGVLAAPHGTQGGLPQGAHSGESIESILDHGCLTWADMPYADTMDMTHMPTVAEMRAALRWKGAAGGRITAINTPAGLNTLKSHLAGGDIAVGAWAAPLYWNFERYPNGGGTSNGVYYRAADGESRGVGHALTIIGYDDDREYVDDRDGTTHKGALLLVNSWGQGWGVTEPSAGTGGFIWVAYDAIATGQMGGEVYIMKSRSEPYSPQLLGTLQLSDATGNWKMTMIPAAWPEMLKITGNGQSLFGDLIGNDYNIGGNTPQGDLEILLDLSQLADAVFPTIQFRLGFVEPGDIGQMAAFTVADRGRADWAAPGLPVEIRQYSTTYPVWQHTIAMLNAADVGLDGMHPTMGSAVWGDANGNGYPDLAISGWQAEGARWGSAINRLYINNGSGTFSSYQDLPVSERGELAWADMDNDGDLDLVHASLSETRILLNNGSGNFTADPVVLPPAYVGALALGDVDRDGLVDIALANATDGIIILRRMPNGEFERLSYGWDVDYDQDTMLAWGDTNGDNLPDLLTASGWAMFRREGGLRLRQNLGNYRFESLNLGRPDVFAPSIALGDFNNDGRDDIAFSGDSWEHGRILEILLTRADGVFSPCRVNPAVTGIYRGRLAWVDIDCDGSRELVATGRENDTSGGKGYDSEDYPLDQYFSNRTYVFRHRGDGVFSESGMMLPGTSGNLGPSIAAPVDIDGDGDVDVLSAGCYGGASETWVGTGGPPASTVKTFMLENQAENYFATARINAAPPAPTQLVADALGDGAVRFNWAAPADDHTPALGLRYILRVGTSPGAHDVVSGAVAPDALGLLVKPGVIMNSMPPGTLYWSVRAVDAGLAQSPWSDEQAVDAPTYDQLGRLELIVSPSNTGTTDPAPGVHRPEIGSMVTIEAIPAAGYQFVRWDGLVSGETANRLDLTVQANQVVTAVFEAKTVAVPSPDWVRVPVQYQQTPFYTWGNMQHVVAALGNALYIIPGWGMGYNDRFWYSADGQSWSRSSSTLDSTVGVRYDAASAIFNGRLWILGGQKPPWDDRNDVWSASSPSTGSLSWQQEVAAAPWAARYGAGCAVFDSKLWLVGGRDSDFNRFNDVWYSTDGANWTAVPDAPWPATDFVKLIALDNALLALLPTSPGSDPAAVWQTTDGSTWTQLTDSVPWQGKTHFATAVFDNLIQVVFEPDQVWTSQAGTFWSQTRPTPDQASHWGPRTGMELAVFNNQLWLVGGYDSTIDEAFPVDVWRLPVNNEPSPAGVLWMSVTPDDAGTTMPPPGQHTDLKGQAYPVAATPAAGWMFSSWLGPVADPTSATTSVLLTEEVQVTAQFTPATDDGATPPPEVTVTVGVDPANAGILHPASSIQVQAGQTVQLGVVPAAGYVFSHWSGPVDEPLSAQTTLTAVENCAVTAHCVRLNDCLSAGPAHSMFLNQDGTVWTWGESTYGRLGSSWQPGPGGMPSLSSFVGATGISAGGTFSIAGNAGGEVWIWGTGANSFGRGISAVPSRFYTGASSYFAAPERLLAVVEGFSGTEVRFLSEEVNAPVLDMPPMDRASVSATHLLALAPDGSLWSFGSNLCGELGDGTYHPKSAPQVVFGAPSLVQVAAGGEAFAAFSLGLDVDGRVWAWGNNAYGQLGVDSGGSHQPVPAMIPGLPSAAVQIAAGIQHSLALMADGRVFSWGSNERGQLGRGDIADGAPAEVPGLPPIAGIAAGALHSLAVAADGRLFAWGADNAGQVSGLAGGDVRQPMELAGLKWGRPSLALKVTVDWEGYDASTRDDPEGLGTVWPSPGAYRMRKDGIVTLQATDGERYIFDRWIGPVRFPDRRLTYLQADASTEVRAVFRLRSSEQAVLTMTVDPENSGEVTPAQGRYEYPPDTQVQLQALPSRHYRFAQWASKRPVPNADEPATIVSMDGDYEIIAQFERHTFQTQPHYFIGNLNVNLDGTFSSRYEIADLGAGRSAVAAAYAGQYLVLTNDGLIMAWGTNDNGQCGTGAAGGTVEDPAPVLGPDGEATFVYADQIAAAQGFSAARRVDGTLWAWGLLPGDVTDTLTPKQIMDETAQPLDASGVTHMLGAADTMLFLRLDGTVLTWGTELSGESGRGPLTHAVPTAVPGLSDVTAIAVGADFALALDTNGDVWAWGSNTRGQLGVGADVAAADEPMQVTGLPTVVRIFAGERSAGAVDNSGKLWLWGKNDGYELGMGAAVRDDQFVPFMSTNAPDDIVALYLQHAETYAVTAGDEFWAWGLNAPNSPLHPTRSGTLALSSMPAQRRLTIYAEEDVADLVTPSAGTHVLLDGQSVTLWTRASATAQFMHWQVNGVTITDDPLVLTMNADHEVQAVFEKNAPILAVDDGQTTPNSLVTLPLRMSRVGRPYEGFDCTFWIPAPLQVANVIRNEELPTEMSFDWFVTSGEGGGFLRVLGFGLNDPLCDPEMILAEIVLVVPADCPVGDYLLDDPATVTRSATPAALAFDNGARTTAPELAPSVLSVRELNRLNLRLRFTPTVSEDERLADDAFNLLADWPELRVDQPVFVEVWARPQEARELTQCAVSLQLAGPATFSALRHSNVLQTATSGLLSSDSVGNFGGATATESWGTGLGADEWVLVGAAEITPSAVASLQVELTSADGKLLSDAGDVAEDVQTVTIENSPCSVDASANAVPTSAALTRFDSQGGAVEVFLPPQDPNAQDEGALTVTILSAPPAEAGDLTPVEGDPFKWMFTPKPGFSGTVSFTYQVSDGTLVSEQMTGTVRVFEKRQVQLREGWSPLVIPGEVADRAVAAVGNVLAAGANPVWFEEPAWSYDAEHGRWKTTPEMPPFAPRFVYCKLGGTREIYVLPAEYRQPVYHGWNAISVPTERPPLPAMHAVWEWDADGKLERIAGNLLAGQAYWIFWDATAEELTDDDWN